MALHAVVAHPVTSPQLRVTPGAVWSLHPGYPCCTQLGAVVGVGVWLREVGVWGLGVCTALLCAFCAGPGWYY